MSMPWSFIYESHNTMVNRKRTQLIQNAKLCIFTSGICETKFDLNNPMSPEQPAHLKMYPQEAHAICKDVNDFFVSLNHNVQYVFNNNDNNDKMTCTLIFNNKK
jgi:hypothetical protein